MDIFKTTVADCFAIILPTISVGSAIIAGFLSIANHDVSAAILGIVGGATASGGIFAAYRASKIRDDQMRFWIIAHSETNAQRPTGFGS